MDSPDKCYYCQLIIDSDDFLNCIDCKKNVHIKCLKRPGTPGDLFGDVFFIFTCSNCAMDRKEVFVRQKLPWLMIITLSIYNLSIQSQGLSHHGFFHWRTHIANFIDKNWNFVFGSSVKRKKKWTGTVSGTLSHNSPDFFTSGQDIFQDSGWWKLTYNQTPKFYLKLYEQTSLKKQQLRNDRRNVDETNSSSDFSNNASDDSKRKTKQICSRLLPYMGRQPKKFKPAQKDKELNSVQSHLMDFLAANLSTNDLLNDLPNITSKDLLPLMSSCDPENNIPDLWSPNLPNLEYDEKMFSNAAESVTMANNTLEDWSENSDENKFQPRIVKVTNFMGLDYEKEKDSDVPMPIIKQEIQSASEEGEDENVEFICEKSLFTTKPKREFPWKDEVVETIDDEEFETCENNDNSLALMSEYEEKDLYRQLKTIISMEKERNIEIPRRIRRLFRKLYLRNIKHSNNRPIFNIDNLGHKTYLNSSKPQVLDRYHQLISSSNIKEESSFHARIIGSVQYELFESPYTSRILHPFIFRNTTFLPQWIKLMCELQYFVNGKVPSRASIDFCYVRPQHIPAVNTLLQQSFWPGIDMSECLSYPDFSIIALYKKLVVGCAFLVPDVGYNEAYISFMAVRPKWRRCGIANFMLYHLTQTCMGKDITLHVSATNPAICLYQKFGFKIEEVILDFYDKYLPVESSYSRHAFFLRMTR